ncbi:MAG: HEAT repeat domain-containing protein [Sandaracinaceae bacterium]
MPRRGRWTAWGARALAVALLLAAAPSRADDRADYLLEMLSTSSMFRVRTQAAISLGDVRTEPAVLRGLSRALGDEHPAVRAAAARSLARHGDPSVLDALRRHRSDAEAVVRSAVEDAIRELERAATGGSTAGPARFYVGVGRPASRDPEVDRGVLDGARAFIVEVTSEMDGVRLAPADETPRAARAVLAQRPMVGIYLDASIVELETTPSGGLRARVSIVVQSYPARNIQAELGGAATVIGGSGPRAQRAAVHGAFRAAMRNLSHVMEISASRR